MTQLTTGVESPDELYFPADCRIVDRGSGGAFVYNRNAGVTHTLPGVQAALLAGLWGCRTLREHAEGLIAADTYGVSGGAFYAMLEDWAAEGLLLPLQALTTRLNPAPQTRDESSEDRIIAACVTNGRPAALRLWLQQRLSHDRYRACRRPVIVFDDSRARESCEENRRIVHENARDYPGVIRHHGREASRRYLRELIAFAASEGVPSNALRFALLGGTANSRFAAPGMKSITTTGCARNALLLITAGHQVYSSDDDIRDEFGRLDSVIPDTIALEHMVSHRARFYPDIKTLQRAVVSFPEYDIVGTLDELLGRDLGCFHARIIWNEAPPRLLRRLEGARMRVRAATVGCYGARQFIHPVRTVLSRLEHDEEHLSNEAQYRRVRRHGLTVRHPESSALDIEGPFSTALCGLDNTTLLPPYFPLGRREDDAFRRLAGICFETDLFASLPVAAFHNPAFKKPFTTAQLDEVSVDIGVYNDALLQALGGSLIRESGSARLIELGDRFCELAELRPPAFEELLKRLQVQYLSGIAQQLQRELDLYDGEPAWWAEDLRRYRELLEREMSDAHSVVPRELRAIVSDAGRWPEHATADDKTRTLGFLQEFYRSWGELLRWWPAIWENAYRLNLDGRGAFPPPMRSRH